MKFLKIINRRIKELELVTGELGKSHPAFSLVDSKRRELQAVLDEARKNQREAVEELLGAVYDMYGHREDCDVADLAKYGEDYIVMDEKDDK